MKITASKRLAGFFILLLFTACVNSFSQSKLPDSWPANMELKITYGGGMRYYSSTLEIKKTGSYILINEEGKETKTELAFSQKKLDELVKFLKANQFDKIKSVMRPGIVYDMGTTSTTLTWGEQVFGMSTGSSQEIPAKYQKQYSIIDNYIDTMVEKKLKHS